MKLYLTIALRTFLSVSRWFGLILWPIATAYLVAAVLLYPNELGWFGRLGALCAVFATGVLVHDFVETRLERRRREHGLPPA